MYPFSELARLAIPGIIFCVYLASRPENIRIKPLNWLFALLIPLTFIKSLNAFEVDFRGEQAGWISPNTYRGYYNAYELRSFYDDISK